MLIIIAYIVANALFFYTRVVYKKVVFDYLKLWDRFLYSSRFIEERMLKQQNNRIGNEDKGSKHRRNMLHNAVYVVISS